MKIVIFTDTFLPKIDGVGISVENFSKILAHKGHQFVICAPSYGKDDDIVPMHENIRVIRFKNAPLPSYPEIKVVLPSHKRLREAMTVMGQPDLIHIQTPGLLGQYGVMASRMYGVPMIGTYHTLVSEQDTYISLYRLLKVDSLINLFKSDKSVKKRLDKIERKPSKTIKKRIIFRLCNSLYETGRLIISPSHLIRQELMAEGVKTPIEVISNGMDLSQFKGEVKQTPHNPPRFVHVGRISYEKNCEVVLRAFSLIREKIPDATLDIYGDGPAVTSLRIEAHQLGIEKNVTFHGFVKRAELPAIYPQYDVFLTASTMETQGLVVLEAMACGLPCVGVEAFALPELIHHDRNGFIVEPFHHIDMGQRALQIVQDVEMYRRFSEQSLEIAQEHEIHACADRLEAVYQMVAEDKL